MRFWKSSGKVVKKDREVAAGRDREEVAGKDEDVAAPKIKKGGGGRDRHWTRTQTHGIGQQ